MAKYYPTEHDDKTEDWRGLILYPDRSNLLTGKAKSVLGRRYLHKNRNGTFTESYQEMFGRVALAVAGAYMKEQAETVRVLSSGYKLVDLSTARSELAQKFYEIMSALIFVPNSPTLMNAGKEGAKQLLSACFVLPVEDSMKGIFKTLSDAVIIHQYGGGTGYSFSKLREEGAYIATTGGTSSGPIEFMKIFNAATDAVKQGGTRRGANMSCFRVDHPDIEKFIHLKDDLTQMTNFNISVAITSEFMEALKNNTDYPIRDPQTGLPYYKDGEPVFKNAKDIMMQIATSAHATGEPGLIFIDRVNEYNPVSSDIIYTTNPCVCGETLILTREGYYPITDFIGEEIDIWNGEQWSTVTPKITGHDQEILDIEFSDGCELSCTLKHRFKLFDDSIVMAKDLCIDHKLARSTFPVLDNKKDAPDEVWYTKGFYSGDGSINRSARSHEIWLYGKKIELADLFLGVKHKHTVPDGRVYLTLDRQYIWDKTLVPMNNMSVQNKLYWLAGLLDSDGTLNSPEGALSISSINRNFLMNVKYMLNTLGAHSTVGTMHLAAERLMPDGRGGIKLYPCQRCFRVVISASNVQKLIDLGLKTKRVKIPDINIQSSKTRFVKIISIKQREATEKNVYCFNEPINGTAVFNGVFSLNCGEQALPDYGSCNLGSIDISKFVLSLGSNLDDVFNWEGFLQAVDDSVLFLDCVIDASEFVIPEIGEKAKNSRRIGLGIMGLAHTLIKLGLPYDSHEGVRWGRELMRTFHEESLKASEKLADNFGVFPDFDKSIFYDVHPQRNSTVTTIAPTGTISIIANCSSGIEPLYSCVYEHTIMDKDKFYSVDPLFGKALKDAGIYSEELIKKVAQYNSLEKIEEIPDYIKKLFRTASDVSWQDHIHMQAAFQENCSNSISKTINMHKSATVDDVYNAYMLAYNEGCRCLAVYRDGSRSDQVFATGETTAKDGATVTSTIVPRPQIVKGETPKIEVNVGGSMIKMYQTINMVDGKPIEVFISTSELDADSESFLSSIARLISLSLKYGAPCEDVVKALSRVKNGSITYIDGQKFMSVPAVIANTLSKYCDIEIVHESKCKKCYSPLIHESGCSRCSNPECSYDKCA